MRGAGDEGEEEEEWRGDVHELPPALKFSFLLVREGLERSEVAGMKAAGRDVVGFGGGPVVLVVGARARETVAEVKSRKIQRLFDGAGRVELEVAAPGAPVPGFTPPLPAELSPPVPPRAPLLPPCPPLLPPCAPLLPPPPPPLLSPSSSTIRLV